ncbi:nicotianamine synthase family protein [Methanosarcina sp.]|uniref:nicotianamine synthase family protein n=1 Tax=Methanosarcina sp. TaxID=2213 RepID=UPI002AB9CF25|nr:nicotianamine synthase family protein [Methanosarcina sp.]MDY9925455.1 nicotianamine synthase family protein [Methanosarcina sp.]
MVGEVSESVKLSSGFILGEIFDLYEKIKDLPEKEILYGSSDQYGSFFQRLNSLVMLDPGDNAVQELLNNRELEPIFISIYRFRNLYTVRLETEHANEILAGKSPWKILEGFPFYGNYLKLVRTEYEGLGLKEGDRVLFLGSGPLPLTLIVFLKQHGVKSTGIEQDTMRANISKKVLDKLGVSGNISIVNGNHFSLSKGDFVNPDVCTGAIMIAAQAEPKKEIFEHLLDVMPVGSRISCRIYEKGLSALLNRNCLFNLPESFEEQARVHPEPPVYNTVIFLEKKG